MNQFVVRPLILDVVAAFFVSLLAGQRGHNRGIWFLASLLNPLLALCFAAQDAGRWKRRERELQSAVVDGRFEIFADAIDPFPDFSPASAVPTPKGSTATANSTRTPIEEIDVHETASAVDSTGQCQPSAFGIASALFWIPTGCDRSNVPPVGDELRHLVQGGPGMSYHFTNHHTKLARRF